MPSKVREYSAPFGDDAAVAGFAVAGNPSPVRKLALGLVFAAFSLAILHPALGSDGDFGEGDSGGPPDVVADPPPPMPRLRIDARDVLLVVNQNSPVSVAIAAMYRQFYPQILDEQVVYLTGLPDAASTSGGPTQEIIFRNDYNTLIAQPIRNHLIAHDLVDRIYVIITTAGMPYRIEDTHTSSPNLTSVICPPGTTGCTTGTNASLVVANVSKVDAASVESELSVLFLADPALTLGTNQPRIPADGRVVNPYQGYASPVRSWDSGRDILARRMTFKWSNLHGANPPVRMEGDQVSAFDQAGWYSAYNRRFNPGDLYLTARLDGPRIQGQTPLAAVQAMLERSAAVSNPTYPGFVGYNPDASAVALDHSPSPPAPSQFAVTRVYNLYPGLDLARVEDFWFPPGAEFGVGQPNTGNHYVRAFQFLTREVAPMGGAAVAPVADGLGGWAIWDDTATIVNDGGMPAGAGLIGLLTYGRNGGDGRSQNYLLINGPGAGPLFTCVPGAVFASIESYNAVTMFVDSTILTGQGRISQFIAMGGSGAIGHVFEPETSGIVQGEYLLSNLLRDEDGNGVADMCFVEAAFTAIPYLSWAEVVIGDPLMRPRLGPSGFVIPSTPSYISLDHPWASLGEGGPAGGAEDVDGEVGNESASTGL